MSIQTIAVIGAGTMGSGIGQTAALSGYRVVLHDTADALLERARQSVERSLQKLQAKDKISADDVSAALGRLSVSTALDAAADADLVIEAVTEDLAVKQELFGRLDALCKPEALFASNTSSLSLTRLAAVSGRPAQMIGMHFFNPVPLMRLVEIIRALQTSDATYDAVAELTRALGKEPVSVKDSPGFVVNRMLVPMINEAVFVLYEGLASAEEIDAAMKLGANHPIGPLALADMIGIDVCLFVMEILRRDFGDSKYRACPLLKQMVDAGYLGRKSGRGFFSYD